MLIDTHFHLDLMENMQSLIREISDVRVIAVGTTPMAYEREKLYCSCNANIRVGLGLHPQLVAERGSEMNEFLRLMEDARYIGEIGLDFSPQHIASKERQIDCFRRIAESSASMGEKIFSIHSVRSADAVLDELEEAGTLKNCIFILHWFSGNGSERKRAIEAGVFFSINPRMLSSRSGRETIKTVPSERLLLETDAPFTMKFNSGTKLRKELEKTVEEMARLRGVEAAELMKHIEENGERLWR